MPEFDKSDTTVARIPGDVYSRLTDLSVTFGQSRSWWLHRLFWRGYYDDTQLQYDLAKRREQAADAVSA